MHWLSLHLNSSWAHGTVVVVEVVGLIVVFEPSSKLYKKRFEQSKIELEYSSSFFNSYTHPGLSTTSSSAKSPSTILAYASRSSSASNTNSNKSPRSAKEPVSRMWLDKKYLMLHLVNLSFRQRRRRKICTTRCTLGFHFPKCRTLGTRLERPMESP